MQVAGTSLCRLCLPPGQERAAAFCDMKLWCNMPRCYCLERGPRNRISTNVPHNKALTLLASTGRYDLMRRQEASLT